MFSRKNVYRRVRLHIQVRAMPLRDYLMENVIPTLTEGLLEVCKVQPEDPVDYLAEWLFKNNPEDS